MTFLSNYKNGIKINLHVQPRASRTKIIGIYGDALKIAIQAPPVDGEANQAICEYFSDIFSCPKSSVEILAGAQGRKKSVYIPTTNLDNAKNLIGKFLATEQK